MLTIDELNRGFRLGDWEVLPAKRMMCLGGEEVRPEPKVFDVLLALARRDGDVVTKDELIDEVWDGKAYSDEPIQRCIALLRGHFQDKRPYRFIETLQKKGYRLAMPVELLPDPAALDAAPGAGPSLQAWRRVAALVVAGFVAVAALTWFFGGEPPVRSLAVLPIENLSGDGRNQYIVDGIKNSLAQRLAELPEFTIKNARENYDDEPSDIADALDVESVLFGEMQLQSGTVKVTWHIVRGKDGVTIGGGEITGLVETLFDLQEDLAMAVRDELAGSRTPELITRRAPDSAAYNSYMRGMYALEHRGESDNLEDAMVLFQESIRIDAAYGPAYLALATAYALLPDYRKAPVDEMQRLAIETVEQGIAADPSIEDAAGAIFGFVYHQQKRWRESEAAHYRAVNAQVVDSNAFNWYSRMLASVGRLEDALNMALAAESIDPDNAVVASRIAIAYSWLGQSEAAHEYFRRADDLGAGGTTYLLAKAILLARDGQAERAMQLVTAGTQMAGAPTDWIEPVFAAFADPAYRDAALAALDRAWERGVLAPQISVTARTLLDDLDGAMAVARLLERPGEAFEMDLLFIPELRPLRSHPEFMPLLERLGIVAYWEESRCHFNGDTAHCPPR